MDDVSHRCLCDRRHKKKNGNSIYLQSWKQIKYLPKVDSAKKSIYGVYDGKIQFRTASEPISKVNIWPLKAAYAASPLRRH